MLTVGEILKKERESKQLDLLQIEKDIRIRRKFLKAIEENDFSIFSSKVYIIGVIRAYSNYLGLDDKRILAFFRRDYGRNEEVKFKKKVASDYLTPQTKRLVSAGLIGVIFLFSLYFGYQLKLYLSPPSFTLLSPKKTSNIRQDRVQIIGKTEKEAQITIFGEKIFPNNNGIFEYDLPLKKGVNNLKIEIWGANGKKSVHTQTFTRD